MQECGPLNSVLAEHCCGRRGRHNSVCVAMPQQLRERCGPLNSKVWLLENVSIALCGRRGRQNSVCVAMPQQLRERCQLRVLITFATYAS